MSQGVTTRRQYQSSVPLYNPKKQKIQYNVSDISDYEDESSAREAMSDNDSLIELYPRIEKLYACRFRVKDELPDQSKLITSPLNNHTVNSNELIEGNVENTQTDQDVPTNGTQQESASYLYASLIKNLSSTVEPNLNDSTTYTADSVTQRNEKITSETDLSSNLDPSSNIEDNTNEMEYLTQLEGDCFRKLTWMTRSELIKLAEDQAENKLLMFHRRYTEDNCNKEFKLPEQLRSNIEFLYNKIDRIIGVRIINKKRKKPNKPAQKYYLDADKEYLVKWNMLGYSKSTWESALDLFKNPDDIKAIELFKKINTCFKFPQCEKLNVIMADSICTPADKNEIPVSVNCANSQKLEEDYAYCPENDKGHSSNLWKLFLKHKLSKDGLYIPSKTKYLMLHQQNGLKWLFYNVEVKKHGSLLADEMGLGKTCQSIAFLEHLLDYYPSKRTHALVVVQKSVLENWKREFQSWAPHLNVVTFYGDREDRQIIKAHEIPWLCPESGVVVKLPLSANSGRCKLIKPDVLLLTYEGLRSTEFRDISNRFQNSSKWTCVIVDECQKIKSGKSSLLLQTLQQLKTETMVLLTGTPIQNSTEELFPMFTLLDPGKFTYDEQKNSNPKFFTASKFYNRFFDIQNKENCMELTEELHKLMFPYILRREKFNVLKTIPSKSVKLIKIPLTVIQKRVYSALYYKSIWIRGIKFSNMHMQLRKCCIHPFLIEGVESLILNGQIDASPIKENSSNELNKGLETYEERMKRLILDSSGKMILLKKMLEMFWDQKRKVLIFSFFKNALDIIEDFIELYQYKWYIERVDGDTGTNERQLAIDRFNLDPKRFIFLCTTKAGGVGINLTSATVVIHLDSDFNPQNDLQAQARCHRIGQSKHVDIFYFISEHTYEDYMIFNIAGKKLGLETVLLGRLNSNFKLNKLQEETVLRKGIFAAIRDDDLVQKDAIEFAESSIDSILTTKSVTLMFDENKFSNKDESSGNEKLNDVKMKSTNELMTIEKITNDEQDEKRSDTGSNNADSDSDMDEKLPDFWIRVAKKLQPFNINKQEPKELTRADRRRNKNINYRGNLYDSLSKENKNDDSIFDNFDSYNKHNNEKEDYEYFRENEEDEEEEEEEEEDDNDDDDDDDETFNSQSYLNHENKKYKGNSTSTNSKKYLMKEAENDNNQWYPNKNSCKLELSVKKKSNKLSTNDSCTTANLFLTFEEQKQFWKEFVNDISKSQSSNSTLVPEIATELELLYKCIRACQCWKNLKPDDTIGIRTDEIRCIDRAAPWSIDIIYPNTAPPYNYNMSKIWVLILDEWKNAGLDWKYKQLDIINKWSKVIMSKKSFDQNKFKWVKIILPSMELSTNNTSVEQSELQNLVLLTYGTQILKELQFICDEAAKISLTGRFFSRKYTLKKQTWIAAENLCIKLVFIHLMALKTSSSKTLCNSIMIWPSKNMEIDWSIVTEVIKRLNRYTDGAERRKIAIKERFNNKIDSRWNHEPFSKEERNILAVALSNNIQPLAVAEYLPGRSLERVKKGLKLPDVVKQHQTQPIILRGDNISAAFQSFCEPYFQSTIKSFIENQKLASPNILSTELSKDQKKPCDCFESVPDADLLDKIQDALRKFGVQCDEVKRLQSILVNQPVDTLADLLKQLKLLSLCQKPNKNSFVEVIINKSVNKSNNQPPKNFNLNLKTAHSKVVLSYPPNKEPRLSPLSTDVLKSEIINILDYKKLPSPSEPLLNSFFSLQSENWTNSKYNESPVEKIQIS